MTHLTMHAWAKIAGGSVKMLPPFALVCSGLQSPGYVNVEFSTALTQLPTCPTCAQYREELLLELERIASVLNQPRRQS